MERVSDERLAAIALTAVSIPVGASVTVVDGTVLGSNPTDAPLIIGGLVAVLAALAASDPSPLTDA